MFCAHLFWFGGLRTLQDVLYWRLILKLDWIDARKIRIDHLVRLYLTSESKHNYLVQLLAGLYHTNSFQNDSLLHQFDSGWREYVKLLLVCIKSKEVSIRSHQQNSLTLEIHLAELRWLRVINLKVDPLGICWHLQIQNDDPYFFTEHISLVLGKQYLYFISHQLREQGLI